MSKLDDKRLLGLISYIITTFSPRDAIVYLTHAIAFCVSNERETDPAFNIDIERLENTIEQSANEFLAEHEAFKREYLE